jgi:hypothetical protein
MLCGMHLNSQEEMKVSKVFNCELVVKRMNETLKKCTIIIRKDNITNLN